MSFQEMESHIFLMPDYYLHFSCKMGKCRSACCVGWPISISMQNYFHLLGMNCPKHFRNKLDIGLRVYEHPDKERYAYFTPDYHGDCPLRMAILTLIAILPICWCKWVLLLPTKSRLWFVCKSFV